MMQFAVKDHFYMGVRVHSAYEPLMRLMKRVAVSSIELVFELL